MARALLAAFAARGGHGVAAPSANRFGRVSPTRAAHVIDDLGDEAPMVLDGGPCDVGVESTILDLSRERPVLLRPGGIAAAQLAAALGEPLLARDAQAPRAPGTMEVHYAPATPIELVAGDEVDRRVAALHACGERVALWVRSGAGARADVRLSMPAEPASAAHALYDALRALDRSGCARILVERVPDDADWHAVADRLRRAAAGPGDVAGAQRVNAP